MSHENSYAFPTCPQCGSRSIGPYTDEIVRDADPELWIACDCGNRFKARDLVWKLDVGRTSWRFKKIGPLETIPIMISCFVLGWVLCWVIMK